MADFKLTIANPKAGKTYKKEVKDNESRFFMGKKIGDRIKGDLIGMAGYEFEITGGSDTSGFPMRKDVPGTGRKRILAVSGVGLKKSDKGLRRRKTVCGNTIHAGVSQVNLKVIVEGKNPLGPEKSEEKKSE